MNDSDGDPAGSQPDKQKNVRDFAAGLVIFAIATYALIESIRMPYYGDSGMLGSPGLTPGLISAVLLLLSAMLMYRSRSLSLSGLAFSINVEGWRGLLTFGLIIVYVAVLPWVGYAPATFVMLVVFQVIFAQQRDWRYLIIWVMGLSAALTVALYYLFAEIFLIPLP
jgi:hypothetical protein